MKNNLLLSYRHLKADKTNTIVSLVGLSIGLGVAAVIIIFIRNEIGYNRSFAQSERIVRILNYNEDDNHTWASTPFVLGEAVKEQFAEVEEYIHQYSIRNAEVKYNNTFIEEPDMMCTESSFFRAFNVELAVGSLAGFDETDNQILLSEHLSEKYFGSDNPIGQQLPLKFGGNEVVMVVAAVYKDLPNNSNFRASLIASSNFALKHLGDNIISTGSIPDEENLRRTWEGVFFTNYFLLKEEVEPHLLEMKIKEWGIENSTEDNRFLLSLQPLKRMYFHSRDIVDNNSNEQGNLAMLYVLVLIGILILLTALINYLNLTSAQALLRVKSSAIHKICGASRLNIISQLVIESVLVALLALPFALLIARLSLPYLSSVFGKTYSIEITAQLGYSIFILVIITLLMGAVSGLIVSIGAFRFGLINALKGGNRVNGKYNYSRILMVVFQLVVFISLLSTMFLVQKQVRYAFHKHLGFDKEGLICVSLGGVNAKVFKQEILKNPNVLSASGTLWMPPSNNKMHVTIPKVSDPAEKVTVNGLLVDYGFAETMGMEILMGTGFDKEKVTSGVLVNESAISALGLSEVIGEETAFGTVVGVVNDFNMSSLHEQITPMVISLNPAMSKRLAIRISMADVDQTIDYIESVWQQLGGRASFSFKFTDDLLDKMYEQEVLFSRIIGILAIVAIIIASLGLLGLSLLMANQRTKEIGIRKVNGAKTSEILLILNKDFIKWVAIAFVIACPIAYYAMSKWLNNFAYKTELSWWIFALAGLLALFIALLTVSVQSWKAASRNPIESLRYE
ncbi:FtsX-like permease family protein [Carboxylicivirga taeanensis]|uniref:ABC transporter permease n=1 Tax=Carboxylicivirga taeanensis TaxID=1416875 RepID=UPI003F6DAF70